MRGLVVLSTLLLLSGCVYGPFELTHEYGHKPKFRVNTGIDCAKVKVRRDKVWLDIKKEF